MKILGLTGPSGAGKGAVCAIFAKYGIPCIDTDAVYHQLLAESDALTAELADAFGTAILDADGKVDRKKLGAAVFGKENTTELLHTLNHITHKYVMAKTWEIVHDLEKEGAKAVLIDAPQLFEAGWESRCDKIIGVLADRDTRLARIIARDGIDRDAALRRINAQREDAFFRRSCHTILENNGSMAELEQQIRQSMLLGTWE